MSCRCTHCDCNDLLESLILYLGITKCWCDNGIVFNYDANEHNEAPLYIDCKDCGGKGFKKDD